MRAQSGLRQRLVLLVKSLPRESCLAEAFKTEDFATVKASGD